MDDLDHSIHIAEYDWTSFYDESEECCLLQAALACPDSWNLSDSDDSENSSSVLCTGRQEPQHSSETCCTEESCTGCVKCTSVQITESSSGQGHDDLTTKAEICVDYPEATAISTAEHITEETNTNTTLQTEQPNVQSADGDSSELKEEDGDVQTENELRSIQEPDPLCCNQAELNVNEPFTTDRAVSEGVSGVALRAEKERWFVTVNYSPARPQVRAASVKKKRRQKKLCKDNHMGRPGQEGLLENGKIIKNNNESEGGTDTECVTHTNQKSKGYQDGEEDPESVHMGLISDSSQVSLTSGEEDDLLEKLVMSHFPTEPTTDRKQHDPSSSASTPDDTFTPKEPSRLDSVESDDAAEFLSTHSFDSEIYLSATESEEDLQRLIVEHQSSLSLTENSHLFNLTENDNADFTPDRDSGDSPLSCTVTVPNTEGHESTDVEPTLTFPSAHQNADKIPDDNSTCNNHTHSTPPSDAPELQQHEVNLSASGCSSGDQLLPVPELTLTPCSVADSPEAYAEAAGHTRPVYAISAFWDEMEKLTINDILQLRMGRRTPPRETQDTVTPVTDDHSSVADTVEYNSSDGGLMDTSDTADSDYFTQPDESKPDRSSCEFSTSDFEEEYWQFLSASRNPSPDPQSKKSTSDSLFFAHEEEESSGSEGKETPVPSEDYERKCFEDEDSNALISSELPLPTQITKSKSVRNVQALITDDSSLQVLLGNDESSLFLSSCPSLEENMVLKTSDSLEKLTPAPFLDEHYQISIPEVFEYFFTEDKTKTDSRGVAVYDPEDFSAAPVFDFTLCTVRDESSFSPLHDLPCIEKKPIPIFSCSHPTVRELTFPNQDYVFLSADCEMEDDISPIRVVSRTFIQGSDCGAAASHGFLTWKSLMRKIRFPDKGSIWCSRSGAWVFPVEAEKITIKSADPPVTVLTERRVSLSPSQLFRELAVQQRVFEAIQTKRRQGIFSTLKQSDMCLVCIAFASWVLKSSDPESADTWKAEMYNANIFFWQPDWPSACVFALSGMFLVTACRCTVLLANVSALSAIQYLRQYVKKKNPAQDEA